MKTALDPRHKTRQDIVQLLFSYSFVEQKIPNAKAKRVIENLAVIDSKIQVVAPEFPIEKINKVDLAILRLAIYELQFEETPPKVVIDEAIELAKEFGGEASPGFVNGALGKLIKEQKNE
jgi:N utilization substance protein B